jgi:hypothetical protein
MQAGRQAGNDPARYRLRIYLQNKPASSVSFGFSNLNYFAHFYVVFHMKLYLMCSIRLWVINSKPVQWRLRDAILHIASQNKCLEPKLIPCLLYIGSMYIYALRAHSFRPVSLISFVCTYIKFCNCCMTDGNCHAVKRFRSKMKDAFVCVSN